MQLFYQTLMRSLHQKTTWSGAVLVLNVVNLAQHLAPGIHSQNSPILDPYPVLKSPALSYHPQLGLQIHNQFLCRTQWRGITPLVERSQVTALICCVLGGLDGHRRIMATATTAFILREYFPSPALPLLLLSTLFLWPLLTVSTLSNILNPETTWC